MKEIQLTQGKIALVDDGDFERLNAFKWQARKNHRVWYARRSESKQPRKCITMHHYILTLPDSVHVDHRDGNGLNNQRLNLRVATHAQNQINRGLPCNNTSGFKGVSRSFGHWRAQITDNGKRANLGTYADPADAARAYDRKAKELFGEFAWLNFPGENNDRQT
jgi:hypothetical protein